MLLLPVLQKVNQTQSSQLVLRKLSLHYQNIVCLQSETYLRCVIWRENNLTHFLFYLEYIFYIQASIKYAFWSLPWFTVISQILENKKIGNQARKRIFDVIFLICGNLTNLRGWKIFCFNSKKITVLLQTESPKDLAKLVIRN